MKKHVLIIAMLFAATLVLAQRGGGNGYNGNNGGRPGQGHQGPAHHNGGHPGHGSNMGHQGHGAAMGAMAPGQFRHALAQIDARQFEAERLRVATRIARNNLLTANQIKMMADRLAFENSKLSFAKDAYASCVNPGQYYIVNDVFRFSSSIRDLDRFIASAGPRPGGGNVGVNGYYGGGTTTTHMSGGGNGMTFSGGVTTSGSFGGGGASCGMNQPVQGTFCGSCNVYHDHLYVCDHVFGTLMRSIDRQTFDSDKVVVAQQIVRDRVLSASQIRRIMTLFTFDSYKLQFAKFAYHHVFDPHNYFMVNDAFSFGSSVRELDHYIAGC